MLSGIRPYNSFEHTHLNKVVSRCCDLLGIFTVFLFLHGYRVGVMLRQWSQALFEMQFTFLTSFIVFLFIEIIKYISLLVLHQNLCYLKQKWQLSNSRGISSTQFKFWNFCTLRNVRISNASKVSQVSKLSHTSEDTEFSHNSEFLQASELSQSTEF